MNASCIRKYIAISLITQILCMPNCVSYQDIPLPYKALMSKLTQSKRITCLFSKLINFVCSSISLAFKSSIIKLLNESSNEHYSLIRKVALYFSVAIGD